MERYLEHCLSSLIIHDAKLLKQLEVIVIIDGATDQSSAIAHSFQGSYPNVFVVVDKENGNYGSCINKGLEIATGRYVKVLDADDSFDTTNFEDYLLFLNGVDADMVITPYVVVDEAERVLRHEVYDLPWNTILTWKQLTPAFKKGVLQMHAVTYKLKNLKDMHYRQSEGISYTDQEWIFAPLTIVDTAIMYPNVIYRYLVGREGQTINPEILKRNISHNEQCCRRIVEDYKTLPKFEYAKQEYVDYRFKLTITAMYYWYLIQYPDLDLQQLIRFDDYIRSIDPAYIRLLDEHRLKYTHLHYIKQWHKNRQRRLKICSLYGFYAKVMNKICIYGK